MKMLKILTLGAFLLTTNVFSSSYTGYDDDKTYKPNTTVNVYESGFFHGINCVERELELQGQSDDIVYFKRYLVTINIDNMPKERILIYKNYGYEEGLIPITVKDGKLVFKSFDREADAKYLVNNILNPKYFRGEVKAKVEENNKSDGYIKADFIYREIFKKMRESIEKSIQGKVFIPDGVSLIYKDPVKYLSSHKKKSVNKKRFSKKKKIHRRKKRKFKKRKVEDKNFSSAYMYPDNKKKNKARKTKNKKYFTINGSMAQVFSYKGKELVKAGFASSGTKYSYTKLHTDTDGTRYVEFKNGKYVELEDVTILKK